jgi:hypothetical protein
MSSQDERRRESSNLGLTIRSRLALGGGLSLCGGASGIDAGFIDEESDERVHGESVTALSSKQSPHFCPFARRIECVT